jgi:uncharacterized membrane protein YccC
VIGAGLAGLLLALVASPTVYAALLPVVMFVGFAAGPLLGVLVGQALFTIVIATVFAQLEPAQWHLAEVRLFDVALGGLIGVLIGLCAWPRGGAGEMHRASGNFLADCAAAIRATGGSMGGGRGGAPPVDPAPVLAEARHDGQLADASYALYQSETRRRYAPKLDWQATLVAGHHVVRGAEGLLRSHPDGLMLIGPLGVTASSVAAGYDAVAAQLLTHRTIDVPPFTEGSQAWPTDLGARAYHLADLWVWLDGVGDDLTRLRPQATDAPTA